MRVVIYLSIFILVVNTVMGASILHPFRQLSLDQTTLSDHALRIAALELSVSQILVQLNGDARRPSLQRRPEIRQSSRSDTSVPSLRRLHSNNSNQSGGGGGIRLHDDYLSPPEA